MQVIIVPVKDSSLYRRISCSNHSIELTSEHFPLSAAGKARIKTKHFPYQSEIPRNLLRGSFNEESL